MKIGVVVEGKAEFVALPRLHAALRVETGATIVGPTFAPVHPTASASLIANGCRTALRVLERKGVDRIVVLLDREDCPCCAGDRSGELTAALQSRSTVPVSVVLKDRCFENWLIADVAAVRGVKGFDVSKAAERLVAPNKADRVDAQAWLKTASKGYYEKVGHAERILRDASPNRIAANSRSFRRLLRVLGHPAYAVQSARPA